MVAAAIALAADLLGREVVERADDPGLSVVSPPVRLVTPKSVR